MPPHAPAESGHWQPQRPHGPRQWGYHSASTGGAYQHPPPWQLDFTADPAGHRGHQRSRGAGSSHTYPPVREVWRGQVHEAMREIGALIQAGYTHVALDTEFPGQIIEPNQPQFAPSEEWGIVQRNVNMLRKLIQVGFTFTDPDGNVPASGYSTFQFNFHFSKTDDAYARASIRLLERAGIDFARLAADGIDMQREFREGLLGSGLLCNPNLVWVTFHPCYDFLYLLRLLLCEAAGDMQCEPGEFISTLHYYFPRVYDTLRMAQAVQFSGGLAALARWLGVPKLGRAHQAGSDSLTTAQVFAALVRQHFSHSGVDLEAQFQNRISSFTYSDEQSPEGAMFDGAGQEELAEEDGAVQDGCGPPIEEGVYWDEEAPMLWHHGGVPAYPQHTYGPSGAGLGYGEAPHVLAPLW